MRWWLVILLVGISLLAVTQYQGYQRRRSDPCRYETIGNLVDRYPELKRLWDRHQAEIDGLEARQKIQDVIIELRMKRGTISNEELVPRQLDS